MDIEIRVPEFEQKDDPPKVVQWLFKVGQKVGPGEDVLELETCKALFAIEAPAAGVIQRELVRKGDAVRSGQVVGIIVTT